MAWTATHLLKHWCTVLNSSIGLWFHPECIFSLQLFLYKYSYLPVWIGLPPKRNNRAHLGNVDKYRWGIFNYSSRGEGEILPYLLWVCVRETWTCLGQLGSEIGKRWARYHIIYITKWKVILELIPYPVIFIWLRKHVRWGWKHYREETCCWLGRKCTDVVHRNVCCIWLCYNHRIFSWLHGPTKPKEARSQAGGKQESNECFWQSDF